MVLNPEALNERWVVNYINIFGGYIDVTVVWQMLHLQNFLIEKIFDIFSIRFKMSDQISPSVPRNPPDWWFQS